MDLGGAVILKLWDERKWSSLSKLVGGWSSEPGERITEITQWSYNVSCIYHNEANVNKNVCMCMCVNELQRKTQSCHDTVTDSKLKC